jgi:protein involved in polysaccharide export with SLBB domain
MRYFISICLCLLIFGISLVDAQNSLQTPQIVILNTNGQNVPPTQINPQNLIHLGDLIDVDVIGSTEFDWRGTLTPEGYLDGVDFVEEPIFALCRTESAVATDIAKGYQKLLRNPQVEVKILDRSSRPVSYLYGAVKTPQRFKIQREIRLNELIIISGGLTEKSSGEVQIIRSSRLNCEEQNKTKEKEDSSVKIKQETGSKTLNIKLTELLKGNQESNPIILDGDIITILEADPIYIIGGVENPKQINVGNQMTLTRAITSAGGFSKNADRKNVTVFRNEKGEIKTIEVNLEKIAANGAEDLILQKFDIVEVKQIGGEKRKFPPVVKMADSLDHKTPELPLRVIE